MVEPCGYRPQGDVSDSQWRGSSPSPSLAARPRRLKERSSSRERSQAGSRSRSTSPARRASRARLDVVEQGGTIQVLQNGRRRGAAFLDIRNLVTAGGEQGLLGIAFHPSYPGRCGALRPVHGPRRVDEDRRVPLERDARIGAAACSSPAETRTGTTTAASSRSARTASCTSSMGDGGAGGDPENRAQNLRSLFGKLLAARRRRRSGAQDRGARPAQRLAVLVRPAQRRPLHRRRRPGRGRGDRLHPRGTARGSRTTAGTSTRGERSRGQGGRPGRLVFPVAEYSHDDGCSVTGGYVYRGSAMPAARPLHLRRLLQRDVWSFKSRAARRLTSAAKRSRSPDLTSFGEDTAGELYGVSQGGTVYRLTP